MMSHTLKFNAIASAALLAACGGGGSGDPAVPETPVASIPPPVVSVAPTTEPALDAAKAFLAKFDALQSTNITTGAAANSLSDGCYLANGRSKAYLVAEFDIDPLSVAGRQFLIGSTRSAPQVIAERTTTNSDGTTRREIDIRYVVNYKDGSKNDLTLQDTIISGSSASSKMADGSTCATPESMSDWRFFGNRKIVSTFVNATNETIDRTALATGLAITPPKLHRKFVTLGVNDPAKVATYAIISGPGLTTTVGGIAMTLKLVAPRLLRDAPEFAGKNGNFVNWKEDDNFRICRTTSGNFDFAETANCVSQGATSDRWEVSNADPVALDTAFAAYGFAAGGIYTIKVYGDDGWKTVNGQLGKTPIATYASTLEHLPFSAAALAPAGASSLYPALITSSKSAADVATAIRAKAAYSLNLTWSAPLVMPDGRPTAHTNIYFFEQGRASAGTAFNPASRQVGVEIAGATATALNATVPAAAAQLVTPTYAEYGIQYTNRNGNTIRAVYAWQ